MKNTTLFELNRAIEQWRGELAQSPAVRVENLDELESHVRDAISDLQGHGLSEREAFIVAAGRVGGGDAVAAEFGKVNGAAIWLDRMLWMLIGLQVWQFVLRVLNLVGSDAMYLGLYGIGYDAKSHGYASPVIVSTLIQFFGVAASAAVCGWLFLRKGQSLGRLLARAVHRRTTMMITFAACVVLPLAVSAASSFTSVWLNRMLGPQKFGEILVPISVSWAITQLTTIAALVALTLFLARKRLRLAND